MKKNISLIIVVLISTLYSCKKNHTVPAPAQAVLTSPLQSSVCTSGTVINATQSTVVFSWNASANTDSYDLYTTNLLTKTTVTTPDIKTTQFGLSLLRGTPYSWYVISKSASTSATAQSSTWKFYNAGIGNVSYAPFPAVIVSPTFAENLIAANGTISLSWKGSSVTTGSIANYDVYLGTTNSPALLKSDITDSFLNNVTVTSKTTYYWKVITRDIAGDTSDSGLYQFTVE